MWHAPDFTCAEKYEEEISDEQLSDPNWSSGSLEIVMNGCYKLNLLQ